MGGAFPAHFSGYASSADFGWASCSRQMEMEKRMHCSEPQLQPFWNCDVPPSSFYGDEMG
jgi:hypothetical protein